MTNEEAVRIMIAHQRALEDDTAIFSDKMQKVIAKDDEAFRMAISALERDRWIPITEGLPEPYTYVLTCDAYKNIYIFKRYEWEPAPFNITDKNPNFNPVVAWRPLPDPYHPQKLNNADEDTAQSGLQSAT